MNGATKSEVPEDHVQERGDEQRYGYRYGVEQRGGEAEGLQQGLYQVRDGRLG
jgi:hypothetical protein